MSKAVNAEDHTITICLEEEPAYRRCKAEYAQREREAQSMSLIKSATANDNQQPTNLYKGYKVTLYSD